MAKEAAARIINEGGLHDVSIRKIAGGMGYTSGTLYQLYQNLDALIYEVNVTTLQALLDKARGVDIAVGPRDALLALAGVYLDFAQERPKALAAVFEHRTRSGVNAPESYDTIVSELIGLGAVAIAPVVTDAAHRATEARVLWSALCGIVSLALADNQSRAVTTKELLNALVATYVAGLERRYG